MSAGTLAWLAPLWRASWQGGAFLALALVFWVWTPRLRKQAVPAAIRYWLLWLAIVQLPIRLVLAVPIAVPVKASSAAAVQAAAPVGVQHDLHAGPAPLNQAAWAPSASRLQSLAKVTSNQSAPAVDPRQMILWLYFIGLATSLTIQAARFWRSSRLLRASRPIRDTHSNGLLLDLSGSSKPPRLMEAAMAPCPLAVGLLRPAIVLPSDTWRALDLDELRMTLAHELAHHRRRDLWLELAVTLARTLFFFHPLAWIAHRELTLASEESCDALALTATRGSRATYAKLLVRSAQGPANAMAMGSSLGYVLLQRRLEMLKENSKLRTPHPFRLAAGLIAAAAVSAPIMLVSARIPGHDMPMALPIKPPHASHSDHALAALRTSRQTVAGFAKTTAIADARFQGVKIDGQAPNHDALFTIRFVSAPVHTVLMRLFETAGINYSINSDVHADTVSCSVHRVTLEGALHTIFGSVRQPLTYRIEGGIFYVTARSFGLMPPPSPQALRALPAMPGPLASRPGIAPPAPATPLPTGGIQPPTAATPAAALPTGTPAPAAGGNAHAVPARRPANEISIVIPAQNEHEAMNKQVESLVLHDAEVRAAIRALLKRAGASFTIADNVQGVVTAELNNVTTEVALQNILREVDCTYRIEGGIIQVLHHDN